MEMERASPSSRLGSGSRIGGANWKFNGDQNCFLSII